MPHEFFVQSTNKEKCKKKDHLGMVTRRKGLSLCQISRRRNYMMTFPDLIPDIIPAEKKPIDPPMVYEEYDEDDFEDEYDE